jgi:hypothetical protein
MNCIAIACFTRAQRDNGTTIALPDHTHPLTDVRIGEMRYFMWLQRLRTRLGLTNPQRSSRRCRQLVNRRVPRLEGLEDRVVPAINTWIGGNADWSIAANWSQGQPPVAGDVVQIANGATVTHSVNSTAGGDAVGSLTISGGSTLVLSGGTITDSSSLDASAAGSHFTLSGGTLSGATVLAGTTITCTNSGGTLDGVTLDGILDLANTYGVRATVTGGLTLVAGSVVQIGGNNGTYGTLSFDGGSQTLGGSGSVLFGSSNVYNFLQAGPSAGSALTIGSGVVVHGQSGSIGYSNYYGGAANVSFINLGTVNADVAGGNFSLGGAGWSNSGIISVAANSTLNLAGTFAGAALGSIASAGTVNVTGTLTNTLNTLTLNPSTGSWRLFGGTIDGGTVATTGGAALIATTSGGTLANGVTLDGIFDLTSSYGVNAYVTGGLKLTAGGVVEIGSSNGFYASLRFDGGSQALSGSGSVLFGSSTSNFLQAGPSAGSALTIGSGIVVHGQSGAIGYSVVYGGDTNVTFTNQGTIAADGAGGNITLNGLGWSNTNTGTIQASNGGTATLAGSWSNSGAISADATSTLNLGGAFATAALGSITSAGTVNVTGTLTNTLNTLTLNNSTGSWRLFGGTIDGGTVATTGGAALIATTSGGTLANGVTLDGIFDLTSSYGVNAYVTGGLKLTAGTVVEIGSSNGFYASLRFDGGSQALSGSGSVLFGSSTSNFLQAGPSAGSALTIGSGILVHGQSGAIGYSVVYGGDTNVTFTNQGTIDADGAGGTLTLDGLDWSNANTGSIKASKGGSATLAGTRTNSGTISVDATSTLNLGGTFATATLGSIASAGTVNITGTLTNTLNTLTLNSTTGSVRLFGGTIDGGTVAATGGAALIATTSGGTLANGVTLDGIFDLTSSYGVHASVTGGLKLVAGSVVEIGSSNGFYAHLSFDGGSQTLSGGGKVLFGSSTSNFLQAGPSAGSALTIGSGIVVHGQSGAIGYSANYGGDTNVTFTNQGTIDADGASGTITLDGLGWSNANTGTIQASNNGSATLAGSGSNSGTISVAANSTLNLGGTFANASLGSITSAGTVNITGTLTNTNSILMLNSNTGSVRLLGGTIDGGTVATTGGAALIATTSGGTLANGVTLDGILDLTTTYGARASVTGGLTLVAGSVVEIGSSNGFYASLSFDGGSQTLSGSGSVLFGSSTSNFLQAGPSAGSALTIGSGILVHGQSGAIGYSTNYGGATNVTFTNQGTIDADVAGGTLTLDGTDWTNANTGTIAASNGGSATLAGSWSNSGIINVDATSTLNLGGTFATGGLGTFTRAGGSINIVGALDNSAAGAVLRVGSAALPGSWNLRSGGKVTGGAIQAAGANALVVAANSLPTLTNVTLDGTGAGNNASPLDMQTNTSTVNVSGKLTLKGAILPLGNAAGSTFGQLYFVDGAAQTIDGVNGNPGKVLFGSSGANLLQPSTGAVLTLGPNLTVTGATGRISTSTLAFVNLGTVSADPAAVGQASGTITLDGTGWTNQGTIQAQNGGTALAQGVVTNFAAGTLTGGTWQVSANSTLRLLGGNITTNAANIVLDGANSNFFSDTASTDALAGLVTNASSGSFTLQNGRNFTPSGAFTNAGTLDLTDASVNFPLLNQGLLVAQGASTINSAAGAFTTATGSTIRVQGNNGPGGGSNSGDGLLTVANGFTNNGTIELTTAGPDPTRSATLDVTTGSLTNAGSINSLVGVGFNVNSGRTLGVELINQGTVNVGMSLSLSKADAAHLNSASGVIDVSGGDLTVLLTGGAPSFTNYGSINVGAGHTFTITGGAFTNFDAGTATLTGGTYNFAGTFRFGGAGIVTNAANLALVGASSGIQDLSGNDALANFATNTATFTLSGGAVVSTSGDFSNQGALTIDATTGATTSKLVAGGNFTQSGAGTTTLVAGGILALANAARSVTLQSGTLLQGTGTVNGNVSNSGTLDPGTSTTIGTITINGAYTQNAGGTLDIKLAGNATPGTDYDAIAVTGAAALDGTIHTQAINGFQPAGGDSYQVMTFASRSGNFSIKTGIAFSHAFLVEEFANGSLILAAFSNPVLVNNSGDDHVAGETSLREAIDAANTGSRLGVAVTITFASSLSGQSIVLTQGELEIGQGGAGSGAITIDGSSLASPLTLSGNHAGRVFQVDAGAQAILIGFDITHGSSSSAGGAVLNDGTLTLSAMGLTGNSAGQDGGAVASSGSLTVTGSTFSNNSVTTGTGDGGGAIAVTGGSATITGNNFAGNTVSATAVGTANSAGGAIVTLAPSCTIEFNRFSGNSNASSANGNTLALVRPATFNADDNWWLSNAGPAANDVVSGSGGIFTPNPVHDFLMLSQSASLNTLLVGSASTITVGFTTDSAGNSIPAANLGALANLNASFGGNSLPGSSLTGTPATIQNGQATASYHAGATGGMDTVTATVDGVTVSTSLAIHQPASITSDSAFTFTVGTFDSFKVNTVGFPIPALSESVELPTGVHFLDNGNGTATLSGMPAIGTGNSYTLTITASNGVGVDFQQTFTLTVNEAPSIISSPNTGFTVGQNPSFMIHTLGYPRPALSETGAPLAGANVTFHDNGNGTATLGSDLVAPSTGAYVLTLTAADNGVGPAVSQTLTLNVIDPPTMTIHPVTPFQAGLSGGLVSITTVPGLPLPTTLTSSGKLPTGVTFTAGANGTAKLSGKPAAGTAGTYTVNITASNATGSTSQTFVLEVSQPLPSTKTGTASAIFAEGKSSTVVVTTRVAQPTLTSPNSNNLPQGVTFHDNNDGTATIAGTPAPGAAGSTPYSFTIIVNSNGTQVATETFQLMVDRPPVFAGTTGSNTFTVGTKGGPFTIATTSGIPAKTTLTVIGVLPKGITFTDNKKGSATLQGTPAANSAGIYTFTVVAGNGLMSTTSQTFTLTVNPGVSTAAGATLTVGQPGTVTVTTRGFAGQQLTETDALPAGVTFHDNGDGTATFSGTPAVGSARAYAVTIRAGNGITKVFTLTVAQPVLITSAGNAAFTVGTLGPIFPITTSGSPAAKLTVTPTLPRGLTFVPGPNGTGSLKGTPAKGSQRTYKLVVSASNGALPVAYQLLTVVVG